MFIALLLLASNMAAVQVHREIGHNIPLGRVIGGVHQPALSDAATSHCPLCDPASQMDPLLPQATGLVGGQPLLFMRQSNLPAASIEIAPAGHGWRSRAPPAAGSRTA